MSSVPEVFTTAGSKLSISPDVLPANTREAFEGLDWVEIAEIVDFGSGPGKTFNVVEHLPVSSRRKQKLKGSYDLGSPAYKLGRVYDDAGQMLLEEALDSDDNYPIKLEVKDKAVRYFEGLITSMPDEYGGADSVVSVTVNIAVNSDPILVIPDGES